MRMPKEDVLNAIVTDLVADQALRAFELGFTHQEVEAAIRVGLTHGVEEYADRRKEMEATQRFLDGDRRGL